MSQLPAFKRTRIAPTPSGYLHLGNVLSFLLTSALAEKSGASILLRIDDLDQDRVEKEYLQDIFDTLHFMEINWQEGPHDLPEFEKVYSQLYRLGIYNSYMEELKERGKVFACSCSRSQLKDGIYPGTCLHKRIPLDAPGVCWRLDTSKAFSIGINTLEERKNEAFPKEMDFFVVKKKDGYPSYQLASVADDLHFGVDLIVRGRDLWSSTLAQLYLAEILGKKQFNDIVFYHHPLLLDQNAKMSKSAGALSIKHYREEQRGPEEVLKMIEELLMKAGGQDERKAMEFVRACFHGRAGS